MKTVTTKVIYIIILFFTSSVFASNQTNETSMQDASPIQSNDQINTGDETPTNRKISAASKELDAIEHTKRLSIIPRRYCGDFDCTRSTYGGSFAGLEGTDSYGGSFYGPAR